MRTRLRLWLSLTFLLLSLTFLFGGCGQSHFVTWPRGVDLFAGFLLEVTGLAASTSRGPYRFEDGGPAETEDPVRFTGEGSSIAMLGIDEAAFLDLSRFDLAFERIRETPQGLALRRATCDQLDRAPVPPTARFWRLDLEANVFEEDSDRTALEGLELALDPARDCPTHQGHLTAFDTVDSLLPSGTLVGGVPRERNFELGSGYLHLYAVARVDDDTILARSEYALYVFRRGVPYADDDSHRFLLEDDKFEGPVEPTDRNTFLVAGSGSKTETPLLMEFEVTSEVFRLSRTATVPVSGIRDFAVVGSQIVIASPEGVLIGSLGSDQFRATPDSTDPGKTLAVDRDRVLISLKSGVVLVGPTSGPLTAFDVASSGSTLRVVTGVAPGPDGDLWLAGEGIDVAQSDVVRIGRDGSIGRRSIQVPVNCGRPDECGVFRSFEGRSLTWLDSGAKDELLILSGTCRGLLATQPTRGCQTTIDAETVLELKAVAKSDRWITAVGKEGVIVELEMTSQ
ncbi:MAG: hypothetical protein HY791_04335 [Deltaproteobacteria bacterium]|nr:hypothetical protein [Deltaproteobacteria bacterium]